jgi:hypothetical protein
LSFSSILQRSISLHLIKVLWRWEENALGLRWLDLPISSPNLAKWSNITVAPRVISSRVANGNAPSSTYRKSFLHFPWILLL